MTFPRAHGHPTTYSCHMRFLLTFAILLTSRSAKAVAASNDGQCDKQPDGLVTSSALVQKTAAAKPLKEIHSSHATFDDGTLTQVKKEQSSLYELVQAQVSELKDQFQKSPDVFAGGALIFICFGVLGALMLVAYLAGSSKEEPPMAPRMAAPPELRKSVPGSTASVPPRQSYRAAYSPSRPSTAHQPVPAVVSQRPSSAPRAWCTSATACPELVVPAGSESVLAVRVLNRYPLSQTSQQLDIVDLDGMPVLKAEVCPPAPSFPTFGAEAFRDGSTGSFQEQPAVALKMLEREARQSLLRQPRKPRLDAGALALGYHSTASGEPAMDVCSADGRLWGKLQRTRAGRFALQVGKQAQTKMVFNGRFEAHDIQVHDENNEMLAQVELCSIPTEPGSSFYRVTIQPQVDAGVMLVCLLSIDEMNAQRGQR